MSDIFIVATYNMLIPMKSTKSTFTQFSGNFS